MNQQKENTRQSWVNQAKAPIIQVVISGTVKRMRFMFDKSPKDGEKVQRKSTVEQIIEYLPQQPLAVVVRYMHLSGVTNYHKVKSTAQYF